MKIARVRGREIYDSRGWPTLECEIVLDDNTAVTGYSPTGISASSYEARDIRDGDKRLWGKGVARAVELIEEVIAPALVGKEPVAPELDALLVELDGTADKSYLGGNVLVATSMALYKAYAYSESLELYELFAYLIGADSVLLPCPLFNVINGGKHAENNLAIQEFLIAPVGAATFRQAVEFSMGLFHDLRSTLRRQGKCMGIGEEGGFTAVFKDDREALDILTEVVERSVAQEGGMCAIALDVAATHVYDPIQKKYFVNNQTFSAEELITFYEELIQSYPVYSIEDGLSENDWDGWRLMTERLGDKIQIVGDDIFATNPQRIARAFDENVATAVIIKPNQIGTITETLQVISLCKSRQLTTIISHRSGETEDTFIADLAVGTSAGQIKAGGCCRSERVAKYNRLLTIEDELIAEQNKTEE